MSGTATRTRTDLWEGLDELARETVSSPEEVEATAREDAAYERWKTAAIQEAPDEPETGGPDIPNEEVMRRLESWGTENELPPPVPLPER